MAHQPLKKSWVPVPSGFQLDGGLVGCGEASTLWIGHTIRDLALLWRACRATMAPLRPLLLFLTILPVALAVDSGESSRTHDDDAASAEFEVRQSPGLSQPPTVAPRPQFRPVSTSSGAPQSPPHAASVCVFVPSACMNICIRLTNRSAGASGTCRPLPRASSNAASTRRRRTARRTTARSAMLQVGGAADTLVNALADDAAQSLGHSRSH